MYPNSQSTRLDLRKAVSFPGSAHSLLGKKSLHLSVPEFSCHYNRGNYNLLFLIKCCES